MVHLFVLLQQAGNGSNWFCCYAFTGAVVIAVILGAVSGKPSECQVCGGSIGRKAYAWKLEGKQKWLCANCNRRLADHRSKIAIKRMLGQDLPTLPPAESVPATHAPEATRTSRSNRIGTVLYRSVLAFLLFLLLMVYGAIAASKMGYL